MLDKAISDRVVCDFKASLIVFTVWIIEISTITQSINGATVNGFLLVQLLKTVLFS